MAKGLNEKIINIETPWSGYSGSRVEEFIKNEITTLESEKMGYVVKDINGHFKFYATKEDADNNINVLGVVETTPQYALSINEFGDNKKIFLSNESEKKFVWGFKTLDTVLKDVYREDVSVDYIITNGINTKKITTIITNNPDSTNDDYTLVELDLNEMLDNGTSKLNIEIRGVKTNIKQVLSAEFSIITLDVEDATNFSNPFNNLFIPTIKVTCTNLQKYYIEYRIDGGEFNDVNRIEGEGKGYQTTISPNVNIESISNGRHIFEYRIVVKLDTNINAFYTNINRIEFIKGNINISEPQILISTTYSEGEEIIDTDGNLIINNLTQYVPFDLKYAVYNGGASTNVEFHEIGEVSGETISVIKNTADNNKVCNYAVQSLTSGIKIVKIFTTANDNENGEYITNGDGRKIYFNIKPSNLNINICNTNLRIDFNSNGKSNDAVDKKEWISKVDVYTNSAKFNNEFDWSQGWTNNGLVISENCEVKFDYAPFPKQNDSDSEELKKEWVGGLKGYTFEIEFMTQNVTDENAVVCDMTYNGCGFKITGSQFIFTTPQKNSVSTRFKSDEMNRIALVVRPHTKNVDGKDTFNKGLVELYVNGELSNIAKYTELEKFEVVETVDGKNISKPLTFRGANGADIVIKYIRAYNGVVSADELVNNYILFRSNSSKMLSLYNDNNILDNNGNVTYDTIRKIGNIPFIIFVGRTVESELASGDGNQYGDEPYSAGTINANANNWYETLENTTNKKLNVDMDVIYVNPLDPMKNFKFVKAYITPQGTSSMYYPKKNYRIYTQKNKDTRMFVSSKEAGILDLDRMLTSNFGENVEDRVFEIHRGVKNYKKRLYSFKDNAQAVKCWCLKADFAETSSSHNTGIARLWGDTLKNSTVQIGNASYSVFRTNAQATIENNYINKRNEMPDIRTTIDGFPIVVFGAKSYSDEIVFLGQYNFNNDKSTESVFGFCDIDNENKLVDNGKNNYTPHNTQEAIKVEYTLDEMLDKFMCCVETLDNGNALANFSTMDDFDNSWDDAFEFRYMEIPEEPEEKDYKDENGNWTESGEEDYNKDLEKYNKELAKWNNTRLKPFKHFAQWLYDTRWCDVYGNILPGLTVEEAEARKNKFATEKWDHLDVWKMAAYYIYAMRFGAVDQIVKNSMLTSEGPFAVNKNGNKMGYWDTTDESSPEYGQFYKWYYINYDNDTIMGVKNDGSLAYGPEITRTMKEGSGATASYIYAGSNSTLWNNLDTDDEFKQIVRIADQGISKTMTYAEAIKMFDEEQVGKWCERIYNKDAEYKYISPYLGDWTYTGEDENVENFVDKLFMLQGSRTAHRRWWLSKRFSLFDGKWNSGEFPEKFIEVKCDYGSIGDTFSATAGGNAYFGYSINNKTFSVNEGENPWMGGETFEFKQGDVIDWKLYKNIQIGDPIGIFGSTDMVELNLMGLAKNLSSVSFRFGNNADISNKLERLYLSIPEELLFANATYIIYADDEEGTVNRKTAFEKLKTDYNNINESDFIEGGKYPTSEEDFDATDLNSPDFYRSPVKVEDEEGNESIIFVYFAKVSDNIRNHSCKELSFDNLDKLQDLKVAGYMGMKSLNLTKNKFINSVDARYSNISNITFAEGARIKDIKVSENFTDLVLTRCNNVKLDNIMVNSTPLKINSGVTLNKIHIDNSDGLNHNDEFKDFILNWMKDGLDFKPVNNKSLFLKGIIWEDFTIEDIKTIINFAKAADSCEISGVISMGSNNLSKADFELIETVFKNTPGINVVVKIPYPNILIEVQSSMVAGQEISLSSILYSDLDYTSANYTLEYAFIEETEDEEAANSFFDGRTGKRYVKISDNKIRNGGVEIANHIASSTTIITKEEVINEDTNTLLAVIFNYEGTTKFDIASLEIKDPTYVTSATINGETMINEIGKVFTYDLTLISNKNTEPIGSFDIAWSVYGDGLKHIEIISNENEKILSFKTNSVPNNEELLSELNINATITNFSGSNYEDVVVDLGVYILNEEIILTDKTNSTVMAVCYEKSWAEHEQYLTREEAAKIKDIGDAFSNLTSKMWSFDEFKYFTDVNTLSNGAFAGSNLTTINIPDNVKELGVGVFEECKELKTVKMSENVTIISEKTFLNCSKLENFILPIAVKQIDKNAFGGVGIKKIMCYDGKFNGINTLFIYENSSLTTIKNDAFEIDKWSNDNTTNILSEVYLPKNLVITDQQYNFLLSPILSKINLVDIENTNLRLEDNILYANRGRTIVVRGLPISETIVDVLELNIVERVFPSAFFNCNTIKKVIFNEPLIGSYLGKGAFIDSHIEEIDLSKCGKLERIYDSTFYNMTELKTVLLPENGMLKEMGCQMFYNSPKLEYLLLPNTINKIISNSNNTYFINECGIKTFKLPQLLTKYEGILINKCDKLEEFIFSKFFKPTHGRLVQNCKNLKTIQLPIYSMTVKDGATWFVYENDMLKAGPFNTEAEARNNYFTSESTCVNKNINDVLVVNNELLKKGAFETFEECLSIETFLFNKDDNNHLFISEDNGRSIIRIANGDIITNTITLCDKTLTKVANSTVTYDIANDIKHIDECAMRKCTNLTAVTISKSVETIGNLAFASTESLNNVILPDSLLSIGSDAFNSSKIGKIIIPKNVNNIGSSCFKYCSNLVSLEILSDLEGIPSQFCYSDGKLETVIIHSKNLRDISYQAFAYCSKVNNFSLRVLNAPSFYEDDIMLSFNEMGANNDSGINKLYVPYNYIGYDEGIWNSILLNPEKCNFELKYLPIGKDVYVVSTLLNDVEKIYVKREYNNTIFELFPTNGSVGLFKTYIGDIYDNEIISIYSDKECNNLIGKFVGEYGIDEYTLNSDIIMGSATKTSLFNSNLFGTQKVIEEDIEMANITRSEYEMLLSKVNQLMTLLNKKK